MRFRQCLYLERYNGSGMRNTKATKRPPPQSGFPERLRELRKQKDLSQAELGKLVGLHYIHIGRYERGLSRPGADTLKRLSDALGVSGDFLLEGSTDSVAKARFEDRELLRQFQEVEKLPEEDKMVIKKLLDALLTKKQLQALAGR